MLIPFLIFAAILLAISIWGRFGVSNFLSTHNSIDSVATLSQFKSMVRRQMIGAIGAMVIGLAFGVSGALLAFEMGIIGVLIVAAVAVPVFLLGRSSKKLEGQARSLTCSDAQLEPEYRRIGQTWTSKLSPDF